MSHKVLVTDYAWPSLDIEREVLASAGAELVVARTGDAAELAALAPGADAIMTCWKNVPAPVLDLAVKCRHVARYGVGLDNIDVAAATRLGMIVTNVPHYCADEVQEHAMALILACGRHVVAFARATCTGDWNPKREKPIHRLRGATLGIVGFGGIGRGLAKRAAGFGFHVLAYDRNGCDGSGVEMAAGLEELFSRSDFVSLHVPLTEETMGLVGKRLLSAMKPTAFLINTSRGPVIDEAALLDALDQGHLAGAALDVFCTEPPPPGHPLLRHPRVIATPHAAFYSEESVRDLQRIAATQVATALAGKLPPSVVNPAVLDSPAYRLGAKPA